MSGTGLISEGRTTTEVFCEADVVTVLVTVCGFVLLVLGGSSEELVHGTGVSSKQLVMLR
jgi:hypothetical protein